MPEYIYHRSAVWQRGIPLSWRIRSWWRHTVLRKPYPTCEFRKWEGVTFIDG
jgi:hypothetical protein